MTEPTIVSLCAGYGGLEMGVMAVLDGPLVAVADNDPGAAKILAHRFPDVPNLGDITTVDWAGVGPVDVLCAGFPCQDVSCAGARKGLRAGTRTGVWAHVARAIEELRPSLVVLENVRGLLSAGADSDMEPCAWCVGEAGDELALRAAGAVLGDLADLFYDARGTVVSAAETGAPHRRERVFIVAADAERQSVRVRSGGLSSATVALERPPDERERLRVDHGDGCLPAEDPDRPVGRERRLPAPGQETGRGTWADTGGPGGARPATDAAGDRRDEGRPEPARLIGGSDAALCGDGSPADADGPDAGPHPGGGGAPSPARASDGQGWRGKSGSGVSGGASADPECGAGDGWPDEPLGRPHRGTIAPVDSQVADGATTADTEDGRQPQLPGGADGIQLGQAWPDREGLSEWAGTGASDRDCPGTDAEGTAADTELGGCLGRQPGDLPRVSGTPVAAQRTGRAAAEHDGIAGEGSADPREGVRWGAYGPAIARWEHVLGRPAPRPTEPGRTGERLSPAFVEWLMGLPQGWVTEVPGLTRNAQLKALGNGCVPQQVALALSLLLPSVREVAA